MGNTKIKSGTGKSIYFTPRGLELLYEIVGQALVIDDNSFSEQDLGELTAMQKKANNMLSALKADSEV